MSVFSLVLFAPAVAIFVAPDVYRADFGRDLYDALEALTVLRATTAAFVGVSAIAAVSVLMTPRPPLQPAVAIALAYLVYLIMISVFYGTFDPRQLLLPATALAAATCWNTPLERIYRYASVTLRIFLAGSVALALFAPSLAYLERFIENRRFLGIPQLAGLTIHPNILGPIAALALLMELAGSPWRKRIPWIALAVLVLVWSGSRTGWIAALAVCIVIVLRKNQAERTSGVVLVAALLGGGVVLLGATSLLSLTGRMDAWALSIEMLQERPITGSGIGSFVARSADAGIGWANTAHNQVLHSLAEGGFIGAALIVSFALAALNWARHRWREGHWVPMALVAGLIASGLTESPFGPGGLNAFVVLTIIAISSNCTSLLPKTIDSTIPSIPTIGSGDRGVNRRSAGPSQSAPAPHPTGST
jgi:O-antigen ligase